MALFLSFIAIAAGLLLCPASALNALFSEPLQALFCSQNLTSGSLTLALSCDCSLVLYDGGVPVLDFNTSVATHKCALFQDVQGELLLVPDDEHIPTGVISSATWQGKYALLIIHNKLGIFGPAIWSTGVSYQPWTWNSYRRALRGGEAQQLRGPSYAGYFLFGGGIVSGNNSTDVVAAANGKFTVVVTTQCSIAVLYDGDRIWESWPPVNGAAVCALKLKSTGELVLVADGEESWTSGYAGAESLPVCVLRYNGEILIYQLKTWLYEGGSEVKKMEMVA